MKDMQMTKDEQKKYSEPTIASSSEDKPRYPWGLVINLDSDCLEKLGIEKLPQVGEKMKLHAIVEVSSANSYASQTGKSQSIGLQITAMELAAHKEEKKAEDVLYGKE
jgi:hypothetical protein